MSNPIFEPVPTPFRFSAAEHDIIAFWKEKQVYHKSLEQRHGAPHFVFYEGPPTANGITISDDGKVDYLVPGQIARQQAGQIKLFNFINPNGLKLLGGNIYQQTESSGQATQSDPGKDGIGTLQQSFLEGSNVDPVKELVSLIKTQRAFELNSQSIQAADQALQTIGNLRRN